MKMKLMGLAVLVAVGVYFAQQATTGAALPRWVPPRAQVYLEAKDFGALLREWNGSAEKRQWVGGANYNVFSKSRLFLRLEEAQGEFATAAGLPVDSGLLNQLAGGASALAIYDIGKLEFLYITKLAAAPALTALAGQFANRTAGGTTYYVKADRATQRTAAFATKDGWLLLSTNEDYLARALVLMAGQAGGSLATEGWYQRAGQTQGELRMAANLELLAKSPHFKSYWVQRNVAELAAYEGAMADLTRSGGAWVESRTMTKRQAGTAGNGAALRSLARAVPNDAGYYHLAMGAPAAGLLATAAGATFREGQNETDLETMIDVVPFLAAGAGNEAALAAAFGNATAHVVVRGTRVQQDQVFVAQTLGVAVAGAGNWNLAAMRALLPGYSVAVAGTTLYVANHEPLLRAMQAGGTLTVGEERTVYLASFRHGTERAGLLRLTTLIDRAGATPAEQPEQRQPEFFSENVASLSQVLARLQTATVARLDQGDKVTERVTYALRP